MEYFQIRKNSRQVVRIFRGPYEGLDITRLQLWYKNPGDEDYKPGKIVAFASELIPGIIEGLMRMSVSEPSVDTGITSGCDLSDNSPDLIKALQKLLKAHKRPLHWENVCMILNEEKPSLYVTRWTVYNTLLGNPDIFDEVEEDVFAARM